MRALTPRLFALLLCLLLPLSASAKKPHSKKTLVDATPKLEAPTTEIGPAGVVDEFHEDLRQRKREEALALLDEDAVIFETGYAGQSRADYASGHVSDDADFAGVTDYRLVRRQVKQYGHTAVVLSQGSVTGLFGDQNVNLEQTETMVLRQGPAGWRIIHIHWSAHTLPDATAPQSAPTQDVPPPDAVPTVSLPDSDSPPPESAPAPATPSSFDTSPQTPSEPQ